MKEEMKSFPDLMNALVNDRNSYMIHSLRKCAAQSQVVVAVMGAGHVTGAINRLY
jgi:pheromone shutdown protein TraB